MKTDHCTRHAFTDGSCCKTPGGCNNCPGEGVCAEHAYLETLQERSKLRLLMASFFCLVTASAFLWLALRAFGVWSPAS